MKALILIVFLMLLPSTAFAEVDRALITYKGTEGYFFKLEIGDQILEDLEAYQIQKMVELELNNLIKAKDRKIELADYHLKVEEEISKKRQDLYEGEHMLRLDEVAVCQEKIKSLDKWYRSPILWFGVGFVAASALAIGLNYGLSETQ